MLSVDIASWRNNIQVSNRLHLNHAGVSPMSLTVLDALQTALVSQHHDGPLQQYIKMFDAVNAVRHQLAALIGVDYTDVGLTRNTSHSMSIIANGLRLGPGAEVIVATDEFPGIVYPWLPLQRDGVNVVRIEPMGTTYCADDYIQAFTANTRVVVVSWVHWCTGAKIDIDRLVGEARRREIIVICDAIQGLGSIPVDFDPTQVDFIIGGSHKWLTCPSGFGYIAASPNAMLQLIPTNIGWNSVINSLDLDFLRPDDLRQCAGIVEEGNPSFLTIIGSNAALSEMTSCGIPAIGEQVLMLAQTIAAELQQRGWSLRCSALASGLVCAVPPGSLVRTAAELDAAGIDVAIRGGAIRFSPHAYQTPVDIQPLLEHLDL